MHYYHNKSGQAGVKAYEIGSDFIKVQFQDHSIYLYSYRIPGQEHVERMKDLAVQGRGLTTYINQHVRELYDHKL